MTRELLSALFAALASGAAGLLLAAAAGERLGARAGVLARAAGAAALAAAAAFVCVAAQFGRPQMIFAAFANPGSGIFRELAGALAAFAAAAAYWGLLASGAHARVCRRAASAAAGVGLLFALGAGSAQVMSWRPAWSTWTLALPPAGFALAAGAAFLRLMLAASARLSPEAGDTSRAGVSALAAVAAAESRARPAQPFATKLRLAGLWGGAAALAALAAYAAATGLSDAAKPSLMRLLCGEFAAPFWAGTVGAGAVLPAALSLLDRSGRGAGAALLAALSAAGAAFAAGLWQLLVMQLG